MEEANLYKPKKAFSNARDEEMKVPYVRQYHRKSQKGSISECILSNPYSTQTSCSTISYARELKRNQKEFENISVSGHNFFQRGLVSTKCSLFVHLHPAKIKTTTTCSSNSHSSALALTDTSSWTTELRHCFNLWCPICTPQHIWSSYQHWWITTGSTCKIGTWCGFRGQ